MSPRFFEVVPDNNEGGRVLVNVNHVVRLDEYEEGATITMQTGYTDIETSEPYEQVSNKIKNA